MMQGLSGVELLKELKETNPTIEVVMLTAYETLETARQALRYGASDYLNKPFDIPSMRAAVAAPRKSTSPPPASQNSHDELESLQHEIRDQRLREEMARTKGEIYASVLHDINSPLTVISGFIELINRSMVKSERVEGEQLESLKVDLRNITGQVDRCFEISRRYLSFLNGGRTDPSTQHQRPPDPGRREGPARAPPLRARPSARRARSRPRRPRRRSTAPTSCRSCST